MSQQHRLARLEALLALTPPPPPRVGRVLVTYAGDEAGDLSWETMVTVPASRKEETDAQAYR